jgi:hypothetical protein
MHGYRCLDVIKFQGELINGMCVVVRLACVFSLVVRWGCRGCCTLCVVLLSSFYGRSFSLALTDLGVQQCYIQLHQCSLLES